ncbi:sulfatase [uncultured Algibacter sp.]|uniref:sulfatase n=1 Tax=uncultured Algibacter sp. TaxID=298659 RepID=UPI002609FEEC|nr:sulfatase [uncultured Algibacter sp.]
MKIVNRIPIIILSAFLLIACAKTEDEKPKKPNIVFIIADDLGYTDIGAFGSSFYDTPNIDKLTNDGVKYTSGYANCPVCSPSRASFQTGKYPVATGVTDWIKGRKAFQGTTVNDRWIVPDTEFELKLTEKTIAEALKTKGYKTIFAGKWHLGDEEEYWPENHGYDLNIGGWAMGRPNSGKGIKGYFSPYGNPRLTDGPEGEYLPDRLTDEAISAFKANKGEQPVFLCLSYYLVHGPFQAKEADINIYKEKRKKEGIKKEDEFLPAQPWMQTATGNNPKRFRERIKQGHPKFAAMIKSLDDNVGKLINYLKETNQYDNTLIVFVSDNGGLTTAEGSPTSNLPFAKGKGWMNEGGIRVPFTIKPPNSKNGTVTDMPVSGVDIYPTVLAYSGEDKMDKTIDGINLKPFIEGAKADENRAIYWHYPHYGNQGGNPASAIRLGDYKLIHDLETGAFQLYNLKIDLGENNDIAVSEPEMTEKLKKMLLTWVSENYDRKLEENPNWNKKDVIVN